MAQEQGVDRQWGIPVPVCSFQHKETTILQEQTNPFLAVLSFPLCKEKMVEALVAQWLESQSYELMVASSILAGSIFKHGFENGNK